jgi:hypothetical protein
MVRLLTLSGLILLLAAPAASAGVRQKILRECQEGSITGDYSPAQLRDARKNIPTDIDEYSDCRDVLARAALTGRAGSGSGGSGGGGGGGTSAPGGILPGGGNRSPLTASDSGETAALDDARLRNSPLSVGDERVIPGAAGFADTAARHGLPVTLLAVLILLGLCALLPIVPAARRRVRARRQP